MISQEVSDLLYPWVVPVTCGLILIGWLVGLMMHIRRLEQENARLKGMIVERDGVDIFAED